MMVSSIPSNLERPIQSKLWTSLICSEWVILNGLEVRSYPSLIHTVEVLKPSDAPQSNMGTKPLTFNVTRSRRMPKFPKWRSSSAMMKSRAIILSRHPSTSMHPMSLNDEMVNS